MTGEAHTKICVVACALAAGAGLDVVLSPSRKQRAVMARIAAAIMLRERGLSYPQIGRRLGFRHHATVIHYLRRAKQMPEAIEQILPRARDFITRLERACQVTKRHQDSLPPMVRANHRPISVHVNGNAPAHCAQRGCLMPATMNGYCRNHWSMVSDPTPFQKQEPVCQGRMSIRTGRFLITRAIG